MITILGKIFNSDDERRAYFRNELRAHLPTLRQLDGFPTATDDDIINLSDPPFYTACPNPWLNDFIAEWQATNDKNAVDTEGSLFEVTEPYASDVSEGKNNPIYNAHSYHTKVPHPAIMRYILHYTQPNDIVFDGFAGTGMTGVAAQLCANPDSDTKFKIETEFKKMGMKPPVWGVRRAILGDLSPVASFIAYNYNAPVDVELFEREAKRILEEVETECGWMYKTKHTEGKKTTTTPTVEQATLDFDGNKAQNTEGVGTINYTVWSDVFSCPDCAGDIIFWDVAVDHEAGAVRDSFHCPSCQAQHTKKSVDRKWVSRFDSALGETVRQTKTVPVLINYTAQKKRWNKKPDQDDLELIQKIENTEGLAWFPTDKLPNGYNLQQPIRSNGITHMHLFYTKRNLLVLSNLLKESNNFEFLFIITGIIQISNRQSSFRYDSRNPDNTAGGIMKGTLYVPSISREGNVFQNYERRFSRIIAAFLETKKFTIKNTLIQAASATQTQIPSNSVDYIFTDPPFGANIMYSELNFLWESWLKVKTDNRTEAIENKVQGKGFGDYAELMRQSFAEYYRILKPSKWMTVEFSNTNAAIWNGIQTALQQAGFIVANVAALDKKQGSFKAVTTPTAVKQDLVISCYKPSAAFLAQMSENTEGSLPTVRVWDFVREHLKHLPIHLLKEDSTTEVVERKAKILYDRLVSFYIMRGQPVPIDASDFQTGLKSRFREDHDMYFDDEQWAIYEAKRATHPNFIQLSLFEKIETEEEAVLWLKDKLKREPLEIGDLQNDYKKLTTESQAKKGQKKLPELQTVLRDYFIESNDKWRIPDPTSEADIQQKRKDRLLKDFRRYIEEATGSKRLKDVRVEVLRVGFMDCFERQAWETILKVGSKIPEDLLYEDERLYNFYQTAESRFKAQPKATLF